MTHDEKVQWMAVYAVRHGVKLELAGEVGIGRACVGILDEGHYPDYEWFNGEYERFDGNGDVWTPEHAYHKHPCVAVLGRGEEAEAELYVWLRWFDENGFEVERGDQEPDRALGPIGYILGRHRYLRMVRRAESAPEVKS